MRKITPFILLSFLVFLSACNPSGRQEPRDDTGVVADVFPAFTQKTASNFVHLALRCVQTEYPNKLSHVMNGPEEVLPPETLHPVFFGCFDWHSCVHGHWMLVRVLKMFSDLPEADSVRGVLRDHFTPEKIAAERNVKLDAYLMVLYCLLEDLVLLRNGRDGIRNADIREKLTPLAQAVSFEWLERAVKRTDELMRLVRRNIQKSIALDALVLELRG